MTEKEALLERLGAMSFAALDTALFLDTHPLHSEALEYHHYYACMTKALRSEYEEKYGPLLMENAVSPRCWDWIDGSWPWEMEE